MTQLDDPGLTRAIYAIVAIDDHGHPLPRGAEEVDRDRPINPYDHPLGLRMRPTNSEYVAAWRVLWGYDYDDFRPDHLVALITKKQDIKERPDYYQWIFRKLNVEAMLYVAAAPEREFTLPRFHWCAHVDWMLWPFAKPDEPDRTFVPGFIEMNRQQVGADGGELPATLDKYADTVIDAHLAAVRRQGAVAVKFNTAYYRRIRFEAVPARDASDIWAATVSGVPITARQHTALADHLFRRIIAAAGEHGLPVQIHTGLGAKPHFRAADSDPLLLETVFRDYPSTRFVLLHGGWPYDREGISALAHENVYLDFSCANLYFYPRALAALIRAALEWFPEKVLYGSDTHSDRSIAKLSGVPPRPNPLAGWEEKSWLVDRTSRQALSLAVAGMLSDHEINGAGAELLARGVLRDNARNLYALARR